MHAASSLRDVSANVGKVALSGSLQLAKVTTEGDNSSPQREEASVLSREILVEALKN